MDFRIYQIEAAKTDQVSGDDEKSKLVPLLGLAGEVGTLLSEYKKFLRDGGAHQRFEDQVAEDLGDLLWYIANVATKFGLDLGEISKSNLDKVRSRWPMRTNERQGTLFEPDSVSLIDDCFPVEEQIPRNFDVSFKELSEGDKIRVVVECEGVQIGSELTDNAYENDGYRFHDIFHFSYAAILGWSPVVRKLLKKKRRSDPKVDEVEDGARAKIIEELISQLVYRYAFEHNYLEGVGSLDYHLLKTIQSLVADREVRVRTLAEWEQAIIAGYRVWRCIREQRGGTVNVNLASGTIALITNPNE